MAVIRRQAEQAVRGLIAGADLKPNQILMLGCSTSEVLGQDIGTASNREVARVIFQVFREAAQAHGIYLAIQCCEHLNRAIIIERIAAEQYNLDEVVVIPAERAGGALALEAFLNLTDPVVVESIRAHAGVDIGGVLIGMHLRPVAVPLRVAGLKQIGNAPLIMARTRPKYIGGERAVYTR